MKTASAAASGSGIDSPRPSSAVTDGDRAANTLRMRASGSTAMTRVTLPTSVRVNSPVPAATSTATWQPGGTSQSTASGGACGRSTS
ncbi:Mycobacterium rhizamassiliense ORFan [Mycobacterium rhizamassiliense]|uniref:Mycobacterium rhizamassiliense ORFan n=1 Tax=Mycobacterium rhizamassiliense TaxID=1841860 RepID=A0A2U3NZD2_9MYCO|nr:Mycobacterium rhizamassiliense ORFan [Mycobacterium rhizamassiliense]